MKPENQVCTLEQAKRLEELGVNGDSAFYYAYPTMNSGWRICLAGCFFMGDGSEFYPAYNVAELGAILPRYNSSWFGNNTMGETCWVCLGGKRSDYGDTEAQARASKIIFLLENNYLTAEECNKKLTEQ